MSLIQRLPKPVRIFGHYVLALRYIKGWRDVRDFTWLVRQVGPYTMVAPSSLGALSRLVKEVDRYGLAGDLVECGALNVL